MASKKVLITGEIGFVGSLLVRSLHSLSLLVEPFGGDVTDKIYCQKRFEDVEPDVIVHLAALSLPKQCDENPSLAKVVNVEGTRNLADAASALEKPVHFIFTSTAQVYDYETLSLGLPVDETAKVAPQNLYAETKRLGEILLSEDEYKKNLSVTVLRLFNHVHKSQGTGTFMSSVLTQILELKKANKTSGTITVGDLNLYRELNPVQNLIQVLSQVINTTPSYNYEIFNVCSGKSRLLKNVADAFAESFQMNLTFEVDPKLMRKNDPKVFVGSNDKLAKMLAVHYPDLSDMELVNYFCTDI